MLWLLLGGALRGEKTDVFFYGMGLGEVGRRRKREPKNAFGAVGHGATGGSPLPRTLCAL